MKFQRTTTAVVEVEDERKVDGDRRKIRLRYKLGQFFYPNCRRVTGDAFTSAGRGLRAGDVPSSMHPVVIERRLVENDGFGRRKVYTMYNQHCRRGTMRDKGRRKGDHSYSSLPLVWPKTVGFDTVAAASPQAGTVKMEAMNTEKPAPHYLVRTTDGFYVRTIEMHLTLNGDLAHHCESENEAITLAGGLHQAGKIVFIEKVTG